MVRDWTGVSNELATVNEHVPWRKAECGSVKPQDIDTRNFEVGDVIPSFGRGIPREGVVSGTARHEIDAEQATEDIISISAGERVVAVPAVEHVVAVAAVEGVVAVPSVERVVAGQTHKQIVELVAGEDQPGRAGIGAQSLHFRPPCNA